MSDDWGNKFFDSLQEREASTVSALSGYKATYNDTERLDWLLRHITGSELRDMGIELPWADSTGSARKFIDRAMGRKF